MPSRSPKIHFKTASSFNCEFANMFNSNPPALGRASRTGGLRKAPNFFSTFLLKGRVYPSPFPSPGVPKSFTLDPSWPFLAQKTHPKKHLKKTVIKTSDKAPHNDSKMEPKIYENRTSKIHKKQCEIYAKKASQIGPKNC